MYDKNAMKYQSGYKLNTLAGNYIKTLFESENSFKEKWETELNKRYKYKDKEQTLQGFALEASPLCCVIICLAHDLKLEAISPLCANLMHILAHSALGMEGEKVPTDQPLIPEGKAIELNPLMREALFGTTHKKLMSTGNVEVIHVLRNLTNAFRCGQKGKNPIRSRILSDSIESDLNIVKSTAHLVDKLYPQKSYAPNPKASYDRVIRRFMGEFIVIQNKDFIPDENDEKTGEKDEKIGEISVIYHELVYNWFDNIALLISHIRQRWSNGKNAWDDK